MMLYSHHDGQGLVDGYVGSVPGSASPQGSWIEKLTMMDLEVQKQSNQSLGDEHQGLRNVGGAEQGDSHTAAERPGPLAPVPKSCHGATPAVIVLAAALP